MFMWDTTSGITRLACVLKLSFWPIIMLSRVSHLALPKQHGNDGVKCARTLFLYSGRNSEKEYWSFLGIQSFSTNPWKNNVILLTPILSFETKTRKKKSDTQNKVFETTVRKILKLSKKRKNTAFALQYPFSIPTIFK